MNERLKGSGSVLFTAESEAQPRGETGWSRIGRFDDSRQRAMWSKITASEKPYKSRQCNVASLELCSGNQGRDSYVRVTPDNPAFGALLDCVLGAEFAVSLRSRPEQAKIIVELASALDALVEHVNAAAPLSWAAQGNTEDAYRWEILVTPFLCAASALLQRSKL